MFKESFSVAIHERKVILHNVISIVPNRNGILFQKENNDDYQLEQDAVDSGITFNINYYDPEFDEIPDGYTEIY